MKSGGWGLDRALLVLSAIFSLMIGVGGYAILGEADDDVLRTERVRELAITPVEEKEKEETLAPAVIDLAVIPKEKISEEVSLLRGKTYLKEGRWRDLVLKNEPLWGEDGPATADFLSILSPNVPDTLLRAIDATRHTSALYQGRTLDGVLIFRVTSYAHAAGGMREWEKTLAKDLLPFFSPWRSADTLLTLSKKPFMDGMENDINIRIMRDTAGNDALVYGFPSRDILILSSSLGSFIAAAEKTTTDVSL